ncbi:ATP-binding protein [Streptomyces cyaneus]|uniref:ATP-binding protein n=1 Tax=Streptomyces cyaneus TaxID=1904 RepID=UPI000FF8780A|nr:ATP-binding protein [Streptomyces cyaneus]
MMNNPTSATDPTQLPTPTRHIDITPAEHPGHTFKMRFTSSPRGARLARRLAQVRLDAWGIPYGSTSHDDITLIVAELTANAVQHGHVPGRDFYFRLHAKPDVRTVRVEVTDTRTERLPHPAAPDTARADAESGHGLHLVSHLATRWDWHPRPDGPGKTVWAEYALAGPSALVSLARD